jgi:hypothetical protein
MAARVSRPSVVAEDLTPTSDRMPVVSILMRLMIGWVQMLEPGSVVAIQPPMSFCAGHPAAIRIPA